MKFIVLALVLCLSLTAQTFEEVQGVLQEIDATWQARDYNNVRGFEATLGLLPGMQSPVRAIPEVYIDEEIRGAYEAPHTSVKNQASCGSCYAFAACATYESWKKFKTGATLDLSEQDFMMKAKAIDGNGNGGCSGWWLDTSMNLLKNKGVTKEANCPYKGYESACPTTGTEYKISAWKNTTDLNTIKYALQNYGALLCGFAVYSDFSYYGSGVYKYSSGYLRGYHAVLLVGFDDAKQA
ncbi:MAG TPA: C1 family peptidase, partial [Planctomycetota bacterium]|nr:C1 family peptidase [Planctomycetota bacterium]